MDLLRNIEQTKSSCSEKNYKDTPRAPTLPSAAGSFALCLNVDCNTGVEIHCKAIIENCDLGNQALAVVVGVDHTPEDKLLLHKKEDVLWDNGFVAAFHVVLQHSVVVLDVRLRQEVRGIGLLQERVTNVLLVPENLHHHYERDGAGSSSIQAMPIPFIFAFDFSRRSSGFMYIIILPFFVYAAIIPKK